MWCECIILLLPELIELVHLCGLSEWPCGLRIWPVSSRFQGLWVRIPPVALMSVSCLCCVLSSRCHSDGPITRPEEHYRVLCVCVWLPSPVRGHHNPESAPSTTWLVGKGGLHKCKESLSVNLTLNLTFFTTRSRVLPEKLTVPHLVKKSSAFYENQRMVTAFKINR